MMYHVGQHTGQPAVLKPDTVVHITQPGKERAHQLLGKDAVGLVLNFLDEYSPQSINEIVLGTGIHLQIVRRVIRGNPNYFNHQ